VVLYPQRIPMQRRDPEVQACLADSSTFATWTLDPSPRPWKPKMLGLAGGAEGPLPALTGHGMRLQLLSDLHFEFHRDGGRSFVESLDHLVSTCWCLPAISPLRMASPSTRAAVPEIP